VAEPDARAWQSDKQRRIARQLRHRVRMRVQESRERERQQGAAEAAFRARPSLSESLAVRGALEATSGRAALGERWRNSAALCRARPLAVPVRAKAQQSGRGPVALPRPVRRAHLLLAWVTRGGKARRAEQVLRRAGLLSKRLTGRRARRAGLQTGGRH
jgi:hypothetical protein